MMEKDAVAKAAYERGDFSKAYAMLQPLGENGNANAQYLLGWRMRVETLEIGKVYIECLVHPDDQKLGQSILSRSEVRSLARDLRLLVPSGNATWIHVNALNLRISDKSYRRGDHFN